jgi:hypothetical protein
MDKDEKKRRWFSILRDAELPIANSAALEAFTDTPSGIARTVDFCTSLLRLKDYVRTSKRTEIVCDKETVSKRQAVTNGKPISMFTALKRSFPNMGQEQFAIGSVCASSRSALEATDDGLLRSFFVGQVVVLKIYTGVCENSALLTVVPHPPPGCVGDGLPPSLGLGVRFPSQPIFLLFCKWGVPPGKL